MIVRHLEEVIGSEKDVCGEGWISRRLIVEADNMGFSFHDTYIEPGAEIDLWYKNHLEAVYCIEDKGSVEDIEQKKIHTLHPGVLYALNNNDKHCLRAVERMRIICVFNPPCAGSEVHDKDGSYS